jgi:hypothetical protein
MIIGYALGRIEEPEAPLFIQSSVVKGAYINVLMSIYIYIYIYMSCINTCLHS